MENMEKMEKNGKKWKNMEKIENCNIKFKLKLYLIFPKRKYKNSNVLVRLF